MKYRKLGHTDIDVSLICLGTMTWGEQNTEKEAHEQLDYATDQGINFIDTAEMYPVPPRAETVHRTEEYIGTWLKDQQRDDVVLATKVVGRSAMDWFRPDGAPTKANREQIRYAIEGSLERLQTDYIDLYQIHWPDRPTNFFGQLGYEHQEDPDATPLLETLETLGELVDEGKVRYIGVSNETAWGIMKYLQLAERHGLPRLVSVQNPYSLLNRSYEVGAAEVSIREKAGLLAYSPLGFGMLTGKYDGGKSPENARLTLFEQYDRYTDDKSINAAAAYNSLARKADLTPAQLALAWVNSRDFLTSNIIGATSMEQLEENISSVDVELDEDLVEEIEAIHHRYTYPAP
jgi:aryl-alcohol dehydrogenase-like predicted oxidoreductase